MGNANSHSSLLPPPPPSNPLRFSCRRKEVPSARSWWRSSSSRRRSSGRSCRSQGAPSAGSAAGGGAWSPFGYTGTSGEGGGSPKVQLGKDGGTRVELSRLGAEPQRVVAMTPRRKAGSSNGSSLSSEESWSNSPWGGETTHNLASCFTDAIWDNASVCPPTLTSSEMPGCTSCSSGHTEDSGIGDSLLQQSDLQDFGQISPACSHATLLPTFLATPIHPKTTDSSPYLPGKNDAILEAESTVPAVEQQHSRQPPPGCHTEVVSTTPASPSIGTDFLRSRIKRLSEWTGSLSRKKRKIQEPKDRDSAHIFNQNLIHHIDQRQNVYWNFMQDLETGCCSTEEEEEEEEET